MTKKKNQDTYECSYVEVLEILKFIPREEFNKIPKDLIEFYEKNKDKNYKYRYNFNSPKTLKETDIILINLYKKYIASDEKRKKINQILKFNEKSLEEEKRKKYNPDNIFSKVDKIEKNNLKTYEENKNTVFIVHKESFFEKFKKIIFKILNINNKR